MSSWAYSVENFDPAPDEELVCSVCQNVFNEPVQSDCQHVFCRGCLMQWIGRSRTCPVCRQAVSTRTVRSAPPLVRSLIGKLRLRCPVCRGDPLSIVDAEKHLCPEARVRCGACRTMVKRADLLDHRRRTCPNRSEQCSHCKLRIAPQPAEAAASAHPARRPKHDCIKAFRKKLKEKMGVIKNKNKRIKELEDRVRHLEEEVSAHNRTPSPSSSDVDILSSDPESSSLSDDDEIHIDIEGVGASFSSDEDYSDEGWFSRLLENTNARYMPEEAAEGTDDSREGSSSRRAPKRRRPGSHTSGSSSAVDPTAHSSRTTESDLSPSLHTFNRTLAMLQQYNLESDDEWIPPRPLDVPSSEESSDYSSPPPFLDSLHGEPHWVSSLLEDVSDEDPDWTPL